MSHLLRIDDLRVHFGRDDVLRGVNLACEAGEVLGVVGESGSGKSLTALAAMGLLPPGATVEGSVRIDGRDVVGAPEAKLCDLRGQVMSMIFQEPMTALNPMQTIGAQVAETVRIHSRAGRSEARDIARETLRRVGLPEEDFPLDRYPHELSGGQRQRVAIAAAIALRPRLLIADEPTTALDVVTQAGILDLLRRLVREDGMALALISHDLAVVADVADRVAVMRGGEVVETGAASQILTAPTHPYTRALVEAARSRPGRVGPQPRPPLLEVRGAVRSYAQGRRGFLGARRRFAAVRGVSFTLGEGETLALVGRSGCGKSTLARAILGLDPLQGGEIRIAGSPVIAAAGVPRHLRAMIQVVFQDPYGSFDPRQKAAKLITEPFHLLDDPPRGPARDAAVAAALQDVGLDPADAGRYIHEFSGGQRQRLAIARALIIRPRLILLDEAVSALDVRVRAQVLDLLAGLSARYGLSYLFISHDLAVVRSIADRVLVMDAGHLVEEGPTEAVFAAPRHPATQALVAAARRLEAPQGEP